MANRYLVGSGNWSDSSIWSTSDGGSPGASVPSTNDDVYCVSGDYTVILDSNITCRDIRHKKGTIKLDTFTLTASSYLAWLSSSMTLDISNSTFDINGYFDVSNASNLTINSTNSTINFATTAGLTNPSFLAGDYTYNDVNITIQSTASGVTTSLTGSPTFSSLVLSQSSSTYPHTVTFEALSTIIASTFSINGTSSNNILLKSNVSGSQFSLSQSSGTVTANYVSLQDSNATGGATWQAGTGSQDLGNNSGWAFVGTIASPGSTSISMTGSGSYTKGRTASGSTSMSMTTRAASGSSRIETNASRKIVQSTQFSWTKNFVSTYTLFTIGSSLIGGGDYISSDGAISSDWNKYIFSDESDYVTQLNYEQEFNMPLGGLVQMIGDVQMDNTTKRFTPDYMGGTGALFTSVYKSRRPLIINAGFHYNGVDNMSPQLVGITNKPPLVDTRQGSADFNFTDFIDFINNKYVDETAMYTGVRSDELIGTILTDLGFATAQYNLDTGINIIPFAYLPAGSKFGDTINQIVQAENAHMYQDVNGVIRFENRQHWNTAPYTYVQRNITTSMVIDAVSPSDDHIINTVEVNSTPYTKQPTGEIYSLVETIELSAGVNDEFINFANPVLSAEAPVFTVNSQPDGSGTDLTAQVSITSTYVFAQAGKYRFQNNSGQSCYITALTIQGRQATPSTEPIYYRTKDDSSVTAYDERPITISNNYIQSISWAKSFASLVLNDFSDPEKLQSITIRAIPGLKISDLISWQGKHWRIFGIKTTMNPSVGFVQELSLLMRDIVTYFRIGISLIGGNDGIAP